MEGTSGLGLKTQLTYSGRAGLPTQPLTSSKTSQCVAFYTTGNTIRDLIQSLQTVQKGHLC